MHAEVESLVAAVEAARDALVASIADLHDAQGAFRPADGVWTIAENIEHLCLAELSGITKISMAASQYRQGVRWTEALPNAGRSATEIIAATWTERVDAPSIVVPNIGGPLSVWVSTFRALSGVLREMCVSLDGLPLDDIIYPHVFSGPMSAGQRLDFLRVHMERHQAQIARVRQDANFPTS
jgi:DinB superfamily